MPTEPKRMCLHMTGAAMADSDLDRLLNYLETALCAESRVCDAAGNGIQKKEVAIQETRDHSKEKVFVLKSRYQALLARAATQKIMHKMEVSEKMDLYHIRPRKLADALTSLDLGLYRGICSMELVKYRGPKESGEECSTLLRLKSKNESLTAFVSGELNTLGNFRYFYKLAAELQNRRNYNSFDAVVSGIRASPMSGRQHSKLAGLVKTGGGDSNIYDLMQTHMRSKMFFVPPSSHVLRDIQESNLHAESELASMKFCKTVELLVYVQNLEADFKVRNKYEHFAVFCLNQSRQRRVETYEIESKREHAHFLLWKC
ncbi:UNVERIFIED_CONTAM: hypothetical protein PYX00_011630 [Menopon gallinae]|uniref:Uncharacterized protein n=1 Tax=Menopon gallinae TaxID=328185 RepID=A0AAW2H826_9NEOP